MPDGRMPGRIVPAIAVAGGGALAATMIHALVGGDLRSEGAVLTDLLWGRVLLVDVYLGFILFGAWIGWREGAGLRAAGWIAALLVIGNVVACAYLLVVWFRARGDGAFFWHGHRA